MATSREKLDLEGETVFAISGMEYPDEAMAKDILEYSAVKLFRHYARRVSPGFELRGFDLPYMAQICRLVQGMPLGLVLAAAWVEALSLAEIAAEIRQSLDFLETGLRDVPEHHRSLRAVFDYSWNLLSPEEQTIFAKLSIFRGGFTRQAAQAVTGASLRNLMALVNKSLLWRKPDTGRYEIHELLRQYAEQHLLSTVQFEPIQQAYCDYYASFMAQRGVGLKGAGQISALNEIEADWANVRAMWDYTVQQKNHRAVNGALESLYHFCDMRSRFLEGTDLFREAAVSFASDPSEAARRVWGRLQSRWARLILLGYLSDQKEIESLIEASLAIAQTYSDPTELAFCLSLKATYLFLMTDQPEVARRLWEDSLKRYQAVGDKFYIADVLIWLGLHLAHQHQLEAALHYYKQALTLQQEIGNKNGQAWTLFTLGWTNFFLAQDRVELERQFQESLALMREKGDLKGITSALAMQAWVAFCEGEFSRAKILNEDSLQRTIAAHNSNMKAYCLVLASLLASILDEDYDRGQQLAEEAMSLAIGELVNKQLPLDLCWAVAAYGLGDDKKAYYAYQEALKSECEWVVWRIPTLCISPLILSRIAKKERAVELLALIQHHLAIPEGWRKNWPLLSRLRSQLEKELSPEAYRAAWERGRRLELEAAMREIVRSLKAVYPL
jgi:predicted ATPase